MTLQLLHSESPYIWGKFDFLFYQCTLLQGWPLISVHIIGWRKTKLSIKRKLFQLVGSGNSLKSFGRFRYGGIFQLIDVPINWEIPEFTHVFPMLAEVSGCYTFPWIGIFRSLHMHFRCLRKFPADLHSHESNWLMLSVSGWVSLNK